MSSAITQQKATRISEEAVTVRPVQLRKSCQSASRLNIVLSFRWLPGAAACARRIPGVGSDGPIISKDRIGCIRNWSHFRYEGSPNWAGTFFTEPGANSLWKGKAPALGSGHEEMPAAGVSSRGRPSAEDGARRDAPSAGAIRLARGGNPC